MVRFAAAVTILVSLAATSSAFQPIGRATLATRASSPLKASIAPDQRVTPTPPFTPPPENNNSNEDNGDKIDLTGIAFSGLQGKALYWKADEYPKANEIRKVIPADCFEPDTAKSLGYLSVSLIGTALCTAFGVSALGFLNPSNPLTWPFWALYSAVTGTVAMGLWVLSHEDSAGFCWVLFPLSALGPLLFVQRSHAVHHQYTNNIELGETHVPEQMFSKDDGSYRQRSNVIKLFGKRAGIRVWGALQSFLHLGIGWPAYLMIGATGGTGRGMTNHFWPNPLTKPDMPNKELFPGNWKEKVLKSDIGIAATIGGLLAWGVCNGFAQVMALYGGPLLVVNAWLVLYTWLQHTDVDVPHYSNDNHSYVKGALHTIDRPYDKMDPWGLIDFLHHKIGSTHVAHHFDSTIPHYKAQAATDAIKENFPEYYLYDPTPIHKAVWRVSKGCTAVEKRGDRWIWNNEGLVDKM